MSPQATVRRGIRLPCRAALVFPVRDGGRTHMGGLFGGSLLTIGPNQPLPELEQYLESVKRWADVTKRMKVEVQILNHPLYDELFEKLERLKTRKPGERHPLVVGEDSFQRFVAIMDECTRAHLARRP